MSHGALWASQGQSSLEYGGRTSPLDRSYLHHPNSRFKSSSTRKKNAPRIVNLRHAFTVICQPSLGRLAETSLIRCYKAGATKLLLQSLDPHLPGPPIRRLSRVPPPSPRPSAFPRTYPTPAKSFGTPDFHHNRYTSPLTNSSLAPRRLVFQFSSGGHNP